MIVNSPFEICINTHQWSGNFPDLLEISLDDLVAQLYSNEFGEVFTISGIFSKNVKSQIYNWRLDSEVPGSATVPQKDQRRDRDLSGSIRLSLPGHGGPQQSRRRRSMPLIKAGVTDVTRAVVWDPSGAWRQSEQCQFQFYDVTTSCTWCVSLFSNFL